MTRWHDHDTGRTYVGERTAVEALMEEINDTGSYEAEIKPSIFRAVPGNWYTPYCRPVIKLRGHIKTSLNGGHGAPNTSGERSTFSFRSAWDGGANGRLNYRHTRRNCCHYAETSREREKIPNVRRRRDVFRDGKGVQGMNTGKLSRSRGERSQSPTVFRGRGEAQQMCRVSSRTYK